MKIIETLNDTQLTEIVLGNSTGIFTGVAQPTDKWYSDIGDMCRIYYLQRSGEKTISPFYNKLITIVEGASNIPNTAEQILGESVRSKFIDKWNKIYTALFDEYSPLDSFTFNETKTGNNKDTKNINLTDTKKGNNTDNTTYNTTIEDNGKRAVNETVTRNNETQENTQGFNSTSPVNTDGSTDNNVETTVAELDNNVTQNINTKTGTDNKTFNIDETNTKQGSDTTDYTINETVTQNGRKDSGAKLLDEEIEFRNKRIFYDVIFDDIDSIATLKIYL